MESLANVQNVSGALIKTFNDRMLTATLLAIRVHTFFSE
jgi:hypothetical protein